MIASRLNQIRPSGEFTYTANATMLAIQYSRSARPSEVMTAQKYGATIAIDANGGTDSHLLVTLTEQVANQNGTVGTPVAHAINGAATLTLGGLVDAINAIPGFTAWVTDAPHSLSTASDAFTDLASTAINEAPYYTDCLKRSVVTSHPVYKRLSEPTVRDAGWVKLVRAEVAITSATAGSLEIGRDDKASGYQKYRNYPLTATANTAYVDRDQENALTFQGPLLFTIAATALTGAVGHVETMQGTV